MRSALERDIIDEFLSTLDIGFVISALDSVVSRIASLGDVTARWRRPYAVSGVTCVSPALLLCVILTSRPHATSPARRHRNSLHVDINSADGRVCVREGKALRLSPSLACIQRTHDADSHASSTR